jgi:SAM-dependent methyltransferase
MPRSEQREFYDRHHAGQRVHNLPSRLWRATRRTLKTRDNPIREWMYERIRGHLATAQGRPMLEVGCGGGSIASPVIAELGAPATFCDLSPVACERLRKRLTANGHAGFLTIGRDFHELEGRFAAIYMNGVMHHVPDPAVALDKALSMLEPRGLVVIHEPLNSNPAIRGARWVFNRFRNNADWERPLTIGAWRRLLAGREATVELYEGLTPLSWVLGPARRPAARWLRGLEPGLAPDWIYLNAIITVRGRR